MSPCPVHEVIVCTYNGARFVAEQLDSIAAQSTPPDLVSIYDDRSSDGTCDVVRQWMRQPKRPKVRLHINASNLGYARNFEQAVRCASGELLYLCDQDDRWHENKISMLTDLMKRTRADVAFSDGRLVDASGRVLTSRSVLESYGLHGDDIDRFERSPLTYLVRRNFVNGAAMVVRRNTAQAALPFPDGIPHDYWMTVWAALHGGIAIAKEPLYDYRQHDSNLIGAGRHRLHHQWLSIWQRPRAPRLREFDQLTTLLSRIDEMPAADVFRRKRRWMASCAIQDRRWARGRSITGALLRGDYRRFGAPYSLTRDLVALVRRTR